jgi:nucleotide-binding universal stress UspA family protein
MGGIIVGVDESEGSRHALDWTLEEGVAHGLPVKVIHAWSSWGGGRAATGQHAGDTRERSATRFAVRMLEQALGRRGDSPSPHATATAIEGDPRTILTASAESRAADLLVVASRGATGPAVRFFLGSTASYVARHAPCPVAIVPADWVSPTAAQPTGQGRG